MDSQSRLFVSADVSPLPAPEDTLAGAPLPCLRPMRAQTLAVWTPAAFAGALLGAFLAVPRMALAPVTLVRRVRRA